MKRKSLYTGITIGVIAIAILLVVIRPKEQNSLKVGCLPISAGLPWFVAVEQGFFESEGLNVELVMFKDSNQIATAALTGKIDIVGIGATNAMLDGSSSSESNLQMCMANLYVKRLPPHRASDSLVARNGIDNMSDLKGKTVAFFPGSVGRVFAAEILPKHGLSIDDLDYVEMAPPQWHPALKSGAIDAVTAVEPFASQMIKEGTGHILIDGYYAEAFPDVPASGAWFVQGKLDSETEQKIVRALKRAVEFIEKNNAKAKVSLKEYTSIKKEILSEIPLNEWAFTDDEYTRERATKFAALFFKAKALKNDPSKQDWLWKAK